MEEQRGLNPLHGASTHYAPTACSASETKRTTLASGQNHIPRTDGPDHCQVSILQRPTQPASPEAFIASTTGDAVKPESPSLMNPGNTLINRERPDSHKVLSRVFIEATEIPVKTCLLQPYLPNRFLTGQSAIARPVHGVQHACRTAVWALALLQLRRQHKEPEALAFPDDKVPLLIKACLLHDSGREADGKDRPEWERASGNNLAEHLRNSGMEQALAWQCGEAIRLKDAPDDCKKLLSKEIQTLRSLLHDADALDVMRVRKTFYMDRLECFSGCLNDECRESHRTLATEVCQTIADQGDLRSAVALQDSKSSPAGFFRINRSTLSDDQKKQWEHHPHPLRLQFQEIAGHSNLIHRLISPFTRDLANHSAPFSIKKLFRERGAKGGCKIGLTGLYSDPDSHQRYYIKQTISHESACNQVLMASIARLLGIKVPPTLVHEEDGAYFVISEWLDNLQGGQKALEKLPSRQWAKLLLINTIVGNEDITNAIWQNIELTPEGEPVMFDWDWAGLATRYQRKDDRPDPKEDDFSSMPVLLKKLRDSRAPKMNSRPVNSACTALLEKLSDNELGETLKMILAGTNWKALDELIEHSGFLPGDRTWLRQTLYDRMAWLSTRFPDSRDNEWVSSAEYQAIAAAGVRGGWLQVTTRDIPTGQLCITQLLNKQGKPQAEMILNLSRDASNRLSDNLAIERERHRLVAQINYFNRTPKSGYKDWRSDLGKLTTECDTLARELTRDLERWDKKDHPAINDTIEKLTTIASQGRNSSASKQPPSCETLPVITTTLPPPAFPARVSSRPGEEIEARVRLAEYSHGFSKLTGESASYFDTETLKRNGWDASPVRAIKLTPQGSEQGSILFYPEKLPNAQTFEHKLVLTLPGHGKKVVEALFRELDELKINADRPTVTDLEVRWLDALADYHGSLGEMNCAVKVKEDITDNLETDKKKAFLQRRLKLVDQPLDWEVHCRIRCGRLVFYHPGLPHGILQNPAHLFCPSHNINYQTDQPRGSSRAIRDILQNESALSSFEQRTDNGLMPFGTTAEFLPHRISRGGGSATFTRVQPLEQVVQGSKTGLMSMKFKPSVLGRLDACIFPGKASFKSVTYGPLESHKRNKRIVPQSRDDYQKLVDEDDNQETLFSMPLSMFDELNTLTIGSAEEQQNLLHTLKKRHSHWPDGRPIEQIFQHSWRSHYYELIARNSGISAGIRDFIRRNGLDNFKLLITNNPQVSQGQIEKLDGLKISKIIGDFNFKNCSMAGTYFNSVTFWNCQFTTRQLNNANLEQVEFKQCAFEGKRFSERVLRNALFTKDEFILTFYKTEQLSQLLYQSCLNDPACVDSAGSLDIALWLDVMIKNHFLRDSDKIENPLGSTITETLRINLDIIKRNHPYYLPAIIKGVLGIAIDGFVKEALAFVNNNPEFYQNKVDNLDALPCSTLDIRGNLHNLKKLVSSEVVESWRSTLPPKTTRYEQKKVNKYGCYHAKKSFNNRAAYLQKYHPECFKLHAMEIERKARKLEKRDSLLNKSVYHSLTFLARNGLMSEEGEFFWLTQLTKAAYTVKSFDCEMDYALYKDRFQKLWETCQGNEAKLKAAQLLLKSNNVAIGYYTTIDLFKFIIANGDGGKYLDDFVNNMVCHYKTGYKTDTSWWSTGHHRANLRDSLTNLENWLKKNYNPIYQTLINNYRLTL